MGAPSAVSTDAPSDAFEKTTTFNSEALTLTAVVSRAAKPLSPIRIVFTRTSSEPSGALLLHWGVVPRPSDHRGAYVRPADVLFPEGTDPREGEPSVQSLFAGDKLEFEFDQEIAPAGIVFLVVVKDAGHWLKGPGGSSFFVDVDSAVSEEGKELKAEAEKKAVEEAEMRAKMEQVRITEELEKRDKLAQAEIAKKDAREEEAKVYADQAVKDGNYKMFASVDHSYEFGALRMCALVPKPNEDDADDDGEKTTGAKEEDPVPAKLIVTSTLALNGADILLHWGVKMSDKALGTGWNAPAKDSWPENTAVTGDNKAVQTKLSSVGGSGLRVAIIDKLPRGVAGIFAVIHVPDAPDHLKWINAAHGGSDIFIPLIPKPPLKGLPAGYPISDAAIGMIESIVEREMEYGSWTLMHRYSYGARLVDSGINNDMHAWSAMYVWMRYSQIRVLDWSRSYNTKPRELSHAQMSFVTCLANRFSSMPDVRWLVRLAMSCVGRGGSGELGQRIRDDILVICRMHDSYGHGSFMEEWHQKLHNATDPADVVICDGLIEYWKSNGDISKYWNVLLSQGVTREVLASYSQAVRAEPSFDGHIKDSMIHVLSDYGALLRAVHLGTDLHSIVDRCQGMMHGDTREKVNGFMHARGTGAPLTDLFRAVAHARESLNRQIVFDSDSDDGKRRDLIFLDLALESETRRVVEGTQGVGHDGTLWSHLITVRAAARCLKASETGLKTEGELDRAIREIQSVIVRLERQGESHDVGLRAAACLTIIRNVMTEIVDRYESCLGPIARCMGSSFGASKAVVSTFIEEAVRGGPAFVLSTLLRKAEPSIRRIADLGPYAVIAPHDKEITGPVVVFKNLRESISAKFKRNTVVIADHCDGDEDVPDRTAFVVIGSSVDVLSHVAVRARNEHHGLVACLDGDELARLRTLHGCIVKASLAGDNFNCEVVDESGRMSPRHGVQPVMKRIKSSGFITPPSGSSAPPSSLSSPRSQRTEPKPEMSAADVKALNKKRAALKERQAAAAWAIRPSEFNSELVGSKSLNLQRLVALGMSDWIKTPPSLAIPNGAMAKVLNNEINSDLCAQYKKLLDGIANAKSGDVSSCPKLRSVLLALKAPEGLKEALRGVLDDLGCEDIDDSLPGAWEAIKGVWSSVWNERAHLARSKMKMDVADVDMAVLCQKVVDADYAFVIHTTNPLTDDVNEIYAECVIGLGETLVGNAPGQALGFTVRKDQDLDTCEPIVRSYPSKATALVGGEYIFRSDSNAEDLEGFAGAGLHDSIPIVQNEVVNLDYSSEQLMTDDAFRLELMRGIAKIGVEVEDVFESPQDIEGCFKDGEWYVVQARPQV
jgi:alpha-glucan, water dikinase